MYRLFPANFNDHVQVGVGAGRQKWKCGLERGTGGCMTNDDDRFGRPLCLPHHPILPPSSSPRCKGGGERFRFTDGTTLESQCRFANSFRHKLSPTL